VTTIGSKQPPKTSRADAPNQVAEKTVEALETLEKHAQQPQAQAQAQAQAQTPVPSGAHAVDRLQRFVEPQAASLVELRARAEDDSLDTVFQKHMVDFNVAFDQMSKHAPSIVFFGGARLKPDDPYYKLAQAWGAALANEGIPPKTGAGPGAMHAVPMQFIAEREQNGARLVQTVVDGVSRLADLSDQRTLGFNIKLPAEQKVSPAIESSLEIQQFAFRKFALYENVRGIVVFPGGFGTLDELMEVLILKNEGKTRDPIVLAGKAYWQPILDAWRTAAVRHGSDLMANLLDGVLVTDDPQEGLQFMNADAQVKSFDSDPAELYKRMTRELKLAKYVATTQPTAVTVLGGDKLSPNDPALRIARELGTYLSTPLRVGNDGQVARAIEQSGSDVQKVLWGDEAASTRGNRGKKRADMDEVTFSERIPHKEVLLRNSSAYVVLPCADRGKDELCSVLCQIQTGKLPHKPLVLVDEAYWKPIVESWGQQMLGPNHAYIDAEDMKLVTYANTTDDVVRALS
jgi:uncharacterized protein (TIGR00730 family)